MYSDEMVWRARAYIDGGFQLAGQIIPTLAGLGLHLGVSEMTIHNWKGDDTKKDFQDICERIMQQQQVGLLNGGLVGVYNPNICKLMLTKHGYTDKQETVVDAKVQLKEIEITFK